MFFIPPDSLQRATSSLLSPSFLSPFFLTLNSPSPPPIHTKKNRFSPRHNSVTPAEEAEMIAALGFSSLDELIDATVPSSIRADKPLDLGEYSEGYTESEFLEKFK